MTAGDPADRRTPPSSSPAASQPAVPPPTPAAPGSQAPALQPPVTSQPAAALAGAEPLGFATAALAMLTSALWGGTPTAIRFTTDTLPPVLVAAVRFGLAAIFMLAWVRFEGTTLRVRRGQWTPIVIASLMLFVQIVTFNVGVAHSNASHGSLFINTFLFWVGPIEQFVTRTARLSGRQWFGLWLAGISSLAVLLGDAGTGGKERDPATLGGDLILLVSGLILGIKIVYTRHAVQSVEPGKLIFWHDVLGTALFLACSLAFETTRSQGFTTAAVAGLLYQGLLVGGLCFAIQAVQLRKHTASQIAVFSASTPLFGILFGAWFRGDRLGWSLPVAGLGVAVGILMVSRGATPRPAPSPTPATDRHAELSPASPETESGQSAG